MQTPFDALQIHLTLVDSGKVFDCLSVSYEATLHGRYDLRVLVVGDVKSQAFGRASSTLKLGLTCQLQVSSDRFDHQLIFEGRLFALKGTSTFANGMELVSLHIVPECQVLFLNQRSGIYYGGSVLDVIDQGLPQPVVKSLIRNKDSAYPSQKSITQYGECDMECILRQLSEYGITFNFYQDFEKGGVTLQVSDHNGAFPDRGEIPILKAGESEGAGLFNAQWTIQAKSDVVRGIHFIEEENRYLIETQSLGHIKDKAVWDHHTLGNQINIKQLQVLTAALRDSMKVQEDTLTANFQGLNLQQGEIIQVKRHGVMTPYLIESIRCDFKKGDASNPPQPSLVREGGPVLSNEEPLPLTRGSRRGLGAQYQQHHTLTAKSLKYWRDNTPLTYYPKHRYTNYRYRGILSGCYGVTDQAVVVPDKLGNIPVDFPYNYRRVCGKVPARYTRVISWSNQGGKTGRTFPIYKDTELQILFVNNNMDYPMIKGAAANADTGHVNTPDVDRRTHWALPQGQYLTYSNVPGDRNFIAMGTKHSEDAHRSFTLLTNYPNQDNPSEKQLDHLQATTGSREQSTLQNSHILHGKGVAVMPAQSCTGNHQAIKGYAPDSNTVIIEYDDGCQQIRTGGTLAWRNNNPGNVSVDVKNDPHQFGAIGYNHKGDDNFAIYPDESTGLDALIALLQTPLYQRFTLSGMICKKYAPPSENDSVAYAKFVSNKTSIPEDQPMSSLNQDQIKNVAAAIHQYEGWKPGKITWEKEGANKSC